MLNHFLNYGTVQQTYWKRGRNISTRKKQGRVEPEEATNQQSNKQHRVQVGEANKELPMITGFVEDDVQLNAAEKRNTYV